MCYQKKQTKLHSFLHLFKHICQLMRPMRSFLSCLQDRHQIPFPASKFRALLAIWFGFLIMETQQFLEGTPGVLAPKGPKKLKKVMRSSSVHSQSVALSPKNTMAQFDNGRVCSISKLASSTRSRFPGFSSNLTLEEEAHLFHITGFFQIH